MVAFLLIWWQKQMSFWNVRFAQKMKGKTELLNFTKLPCSNSVGHNYQTTPWGDGWGVRSSRPKHAGQSMHLCIFTVFIIQVQENRRGLLRSMGWESGADDTLERLLTMKRSLRCEIKKSLQWERAEQGTMELPVGDNSYFPVTDSIWYVTLKSEIQE